jgi:PKD repeat protein
MDVGNQTSYTDAGHRDGKTHYFIATTSEVSGASEYSHGVSAVIPEIPPVANFGASLATGTAPLSKRYVNVGKDPVEPAECRVT